MQHWAARISPAHLGQPFIGTDKHVPMEGGDQRPICRVP